MSAAFGFLDRVHRRLNGINVRKSYKKIAGRLPIQWQQWLKRLYFANQIRNGKFETDEKEFELLHRWIGEGDWVIDVGANVGHYTCKFSRIVGHTGRVFSLEPVPRTFELLASNVAMLPVGNVTLINAAASDENIIVGMEIPKFDTGLKNYYQAHISDSNATTRVYCLSIDSLNLPAPVKLVKIDAEGHELSVLRGMQRLLSRDHPLLIVEDSSQKLVTYLGEQGYSQNKIPGSSNLIFACGHMV